MRRDSLPLSITHTNDWPASLLTAVSGNVGAGELAASAIRPVASMPEILRYTVGPVQERIFGRMLLEPEVIRMLLFGFALVLMMLFRPAGILPSALRKRELESVTRQKYE